MFGQSLSENILFFISGLGILQAILLSALIYFHPRSDRSVNVFLALHIFCIGLILSMPLVMSIVTWQKSFFMEPIPLLLGPFLYLYVCSFSEKISWKKILLHISSPAIYFIAFNVPVNNLIGQFPGEKGIPNELTGNPLIVTLFFVRLIQYFFYYFLSRRKLISYQRSIRQLYSETSRIDLAWLRWLINGLLFLIFITMAIYPFILRFPEKFALLFMINVGLATPYIYVASYKGITQSTLWQLPGVTKDKVEKEIHEAEEIEADHTHAKPKVQVIDSKIAEIRTRILDLMEQEKLYQETELTLQNLADKISYPSYQVSQAINEGMNKNFYDLVNSYRVEEAKRLLSEPDSRNYTILSIGFEAGFNSKTTFNTVFKKFTGLTPTDYRQKYSEPVAVSV